MAAERDTSKRRIGLTGEPDSVAGESVTLASYGLYPKTEAEA